MPDLVSNGLAWFFVWLFALAAVHKLRAPAYYGSLVASWFPGMRGARLAVFGAAAAESALVVMLVLPVTRAAGLLAGAMLLLVYAAVMAVQLASGSRDIKCGCAGPASSVTISPSLLIRNLLCAGLALLALLPAQGVVAGLSGPGLSLSIACFLVVGYLASEQLIANAQQLAGEA